MDIDRDGIGWITFDDPDRSMNVLTEAVMLRFGEVLDEVRKAVREDRVRGVVIHSTKDGAFIAGADVDAIGALEDPIVAKKQIGLGQSIYNDLASISVPTLAAIDGVCMGGGVEMALACDYRILSDSPKTTLGLPEVQLGLLPAWGGTTRLPRLIALRDALDLLLRGNPIGAKKAQRVGLATKVVPAELFRDEVRAFTRAVVEGSAVKSPRKGKLLDRLLSGTPPGRRVVLYLARKNVLEKTGGHYPAPLRIIDVLERNLGGSVSDSLEAEAEAAAELVVSPVCKNLIHIFHMRQAARRGTGLAPGAAVEPTPVRSLGVLGAGVMGGGIAHLAASRGVVSYMKDVQHDAVMSGLRHAQDLIGKSVSRHKISAREGERQMERISGGVEYHGLSSSDLVVEAVVEKLSVKRQVLAEIERHVSDGCVITTNTSSLSVDEMADALERPERFGGMHFFNPVHRMPLVEVIRGSGTSDHAVATIYRLALDLGKVPVVVRDGPGFLVNRVLGPYLNEAGFLLQDGYSVTTIDRVATDFGMPMGPLRLIDEVGIDVSRHAGQALHEALGDRLAPSPVLVELGETERLGRKGGRGFYVYDKGRERGVDASIYAELRSLSAPKAEGDATEEDEQVIRRRLLLAMIDEAARILDDGIVKTAGDVDLAMIMGTGFPPFRGGLLRFADAVHPRGLLDRIERLREEHGRRFEPSALIVRLAEDDETFYSAFPGTVGGG